MSFMPYELFFPIMSTLFDRQLTLCWIYHDKVDPGKHTPIIDRFGTVGTVLIQ